MTRTRLPRPGEVSEECRLCDAALDVSLENPRRVCAACGEVNFPSKHSEPGVAVSMEAPRVSRPAPLRKTRSKEFPLLWLGLASTAGTIFVVLSFGQLTRHFEFLVNDEVVGHALGIAVTLSLVTTVGIIWRRKLNVRDALSHWLVGAVVGLLTVGPLVWLLFMGIMLLSY